MEEQLHIEIATNIISMGVLIRIKGFGLVRVHCIVIPHYWIVRPDINKIIQGPSNITVSLLSVLSPMGENYHQNSKFPRAKIL